MCFFYYISILLSTSRSSRKKLGFFFEKTTGKGGPILDCVTITASTLQFTTLQFTTLDHLLTVYYMCKCNQILFPDPFK